jgi:uncharacterized protein (TIGR03437 family)
MMLLTGAAFAQTAETIPFRAVLLPGNEVPAVTVAATGAGTVWLHVVRDASGKVVSASTDFNTSVSFPTAVNITGMHIHKGVAGVSGPITINPGAISLAVDATGKATLVRQAQTAATDAAGLDTVNGMLTDPSGFYLNVHTSDNPGGAIRGQLQRAQMVVLMGPMVGSNEVPAVDTPGSAMSSVIALMTRDASGAVTSGQVIFDANYTGFTDGTTFTGFHIHNGPAGVNAPVVINTGLTGTNSVAASAAGGNLHYEVEVPATPVAFTTLSNLFTSPSGNYINLHTTTFPGGVIRSQLRRTDQLQFPVLLSPANEVPAVTLDASAPSTFTAYTLRDSSGAVTAATVIFDSNVRFSGATTFTGMHIHDGKSGANGPVTLNSGTANVVSDSGSANIYRVMTMNTTSQLASLNSLVQNPENHYYNVHTTGNPGGAVRSQLVPSTTALPGVGPVISAISDPARKTVAPGGLMTIFGSNLIKVPGDVLASSPGTSLPTAYNGTGATLGGTAVPLLVAAPTYIVAQVPADAKTGSQTLVVKNSNGTAQTLLPVTVDVAAAAPGVFFDANGGVFLKNSDYSLVTRGNPAKAGDIVLIYSTGLGATTPAIQSGALTLQPGATNTFYNTVKPTVTVGGQNANVIYSIASPGFAGLYQTAIAIPSGAGTGSVPVILKVGDAVSNTANIQLQ